jgi:hypothetical protein
MTHERLNKHPERMLKLLDEPRKVHGAIATILVELNEPSGSPEAAQEMLKHKLQTIAALNRGLIFTIVKSNDGEKKYEELP